MALFLLQPRIMLSKIAPLLLFAALVTGTGAAEWREVFNPFEVLSLHLDMDPADWDRVRNDQPSQTEGWVPQIAEADFRADGEPPLRVTVRRKGESDIPLPEGNPQKVSLKIDINSVVPGQKWRGLTKLSLENGSTDPLNEGFAWILHRQAAPMYGYEAANAAWVKIYVNGDFKGVFVNVEQRNTQFLQNHGYYKEGATWLYKVDGSTSLESGVGNSPTFEHLCYPPFSSGPGKGGGGEACAQPDLEIDLPQWINVDGFYTLAAVNAFTENSDSLFTHSGKNSFAVDFNPPFPRKRMYFPWDLDTTIRQANTSIYGNEPYQTTFLNHPWFGQVYEQTLRELINGPFAAAELGQLIDNLESVLGPAFDQDPYVYENGSADAFTDLRNWVNARVANIRAQLTRPYIEKPRLNQNGGEVVAGFLLTMISPSNSSVYYTLDGTDPRLPGGAVSSNAVLYSGPIPIEKTTQIMARSYNATLWSALPVIATFNIARYATPLRITEIMYNPAADAQAVADDYEFIELKNTGATPLDISGFYFEGINYTFPAETTVAPGAFIVLARNEIAFTRRYPGLVNHGIYWGKLSDGGEKIRLRNGDGNTIISVEYDDDPPWALSPDGLGYSLVLADPSINPDDPSAWRASSSIHGSPGADDPDPAYGYAIVINEVLAHTDPPYEDAIELYNPTEFPIDIGGWYLSDDFNRTNLSSGYDLKKYRIPAGTLLPANGYSVFYYRDFFEQNTGTPFALSEFGETVYLASANSNGALTGLLIGARFGATENGVSIGRYRTTTGFEFVPLAQPTFGTNAPATIQDFRAGGGAPNSAPKVGPVVINEIMYNPAPGGDEFIELLNITGEPVDISGWTIAGANFTFASGTGIPPHGLILLVDTNLLSIDEFRASNNVPANVAIFGNLFVLENEGEALRLERPNTFSLEQAIEIERVRYNDKSPWPTEADGEDPSLERYSASQFGNDPVNWRTVQAGGSPGRANLFPLGIAVARGSSWKYNANGSDLGLAWQLLDYSDNSWTDGDGALGYGSPDLLTTITNIAKPITTYFRKEFVINDSPAAISDLELNARYDDAFVFYLNGEEILRSSSMPAGTVLFNTLASNYNSLGYENFNLSAFASLLRNGRNVLSVELHQDNSASPSGVWDASLTYTVGTSAVVATPVINPAGGEFSSGVNVSINTATTGANIFYTLDGTDPDNSSALYTQPFELSSTTLLKARAYKPGLNQSPIASAQFTITILNPDSDSDGLPDSWEFQYFTDLSTDPNVDADADGLTNLQEYLAGTIPTNPASTLRLTILQNQAGEFILQWSSSAGSLYQVERASSTNMFFELSASDIPATPPVNSYTLPPAAGAAYYRVRLKLP